MESDFLFITSAAGIPPVELRRHQELFNKCPHCGLGCCCVHEEVDDRQFMGESRVVVNHAKCTICGLTRFVWGETYEPKMPGVTQHWGEGTYTVMKDGSIYADFHGSKILISQAHREAKDHA